MTELFDFLVDNKFRSYEDFLNEIIKYKPDRQKVISVIHRLVVLRWDKKVREICTNKEMTAEGGEIYFLFNICWFYRWLLSEGYPYVYKDDCIEMVRKFIAYIAIPGYVSLEIKWSTVFGNFATFNSDDEKAVHEEILEQFALAKGMKTFSDITDSWLILHILLRTIEDKSKIDLYMEKILLNYISLVDTYPELEAVFGVAIEKDMEIVYDNFKKKPAEEINEE
ncbi:MAG: hypothetical protein PVH61_09250 [Candidatus Aminicenantes bacterium]|jgi:hypothetical protein